MVASTMESLNGSHNRNQAMESGSCKMGSCSSTRAMESRSRRAIVMGATSGLGREIALELLKRGFIVGVCGRRLELLQEVEAEWKSWLHSPAASGRASLAAGTAAAAETAAVASGRAAVAEEIAPQRIFIRQIDITASDAPERLLGLVEEMGGMDMYIHSSGIGYKNMALDGRIERETVITNALGFTQMVDAAFDWFKVRGGGHIAFISSVAGTKGLGAAPSYSATKRYQWIYAQALAQLSSMERYNISFTDIRPGFVATGFLGSSKYPLLLEKHYVAQKIVKAILARKRSVIIDYKYKILCLFWRMIPNWLWERLTNIKS